MASLGELGPSSEPTGEDPGSKAPLEQAIKQAEVLETEGHGRASRRQRVVAWVIDLLPLLFACWALTQVNWTGWFTIAEAVVLIGAYALAFNSQLKSTFGSTVPTEPALIAMLWTLPLSMVPMTVVLAIIVSHLRHPSSLRELLATRTGWAFHMLGPVLVLWAALGPDGQHPSALWIAAAMLAQFTFDGFAAWVSGRAYGATIDTLARPLLWTFAIDAMLGVLGYCITVASRGSLPGLLAIIVPTVLVQFLARDRETYLAQSLALHSAYSEVTVQARKDALTGLTNRRGWDESVEAATAKIKAARGNLAATVLVADLDRLKYANDNFGHAVGDRLIRDFATLLGEHLPSTATVARFGGDEFAVLVTHPVRSGPLDLLTPIREALLQHPSDLPVRLSASLGQSHFPPADSLHDAFQAADHAARLDKAVRRMTRRDDETPGPRLPNNPTLPAGSARAPRSCVP